MVRLSQSFVESWRKCPSSAVAEQRPTYGVAAAAGIVAHAIVEGRVRDQEVDQETDSASIAKALEELAAQGWRPHDMTSFLVDAQEKAELATKMYLEKYLGKLTDVQTELSGQLIFDVRERPGEVDFIVVTGTADVVGMMGDKRVGVDYKMGSSMIEPWITQRYGVQNRAYSAMFDLDEFYVEYVYALFKGHWVAKRFNGVTVCVSTPAEREVYRQHLEMEMVPIAEALLRSTDPADHAISPTNWHCSSAWCQRFAQGECLGAGTEIRWISKSHTDAAANPGAILTTKGSR